MTPQKYIYIVQVTRQLSIDIINNFAREGAEVRLITGIVESSYEAIDSKIKITSFIKYNNKSNFGRLITGLIFHIQTFFFLLFCGRKYELIFVTTPPLIIFLGLFFKKISNQNYHLIIWDLYPDVLINFNVLKDNSFIAKIWKKKNRKCFSSASTIFSLGKHLSDAIKKYTTKEVIVIPNWSNTDFIKPVSKPENPFLSKHGFSEKFIVMYSGNMGITHDIESIINVAEMLKDNSEIQFILIGDGAKKEKISKMIIEKEVSNVLLLPYQNKEMFPFSLASADIGIITLGKGAENVSVPSKTYSVLAAGSTILALASPDSEMGLLIQKYNCGKIFSDGQTKEMANFISAVSQNKELLNQYKTNARSASHDFTHENAKRYYSEITKKHAS